MSEKPPRRQRHLHDPDHPRPRPTGRVMSIEEVQRWVMSVLAVTTVLTLAGVTAFAAVVTDVDRLDARLGFTLTSAGIGLAAVVSGRLIHERSPYTPWVLAGLVPALVGAYLTFGR